MQRKDSIKQSDQRDKSSPGKRDSTGSSTSNRYKEEITDEDILKMVPNLYYEDVQGDDNGKGAIDLVEFLLNQDSTNLSDDVALMEELTKQEKVLAVVNNRLGKTVMNNYNSFVDGMTNVQEVGADLNMTSMLCKNGRKRLKKAQENLVKGGLMIVAKYRKKKTLKVIIIGSFTTHTIIEFGILFM